MRPVSSKGDDVVMFLCAASRAGDPHTMRVLNVMIIFAAQVLPGEPSRAVRGYLAAGSVVRARGQLRGAGQRLINRCLSWIGRLLR